MQGKRLFRYLDVLGSGGGMGGRSALLGEGRVLPLLVGGGQRKAKAIKVKSPIYILCLSSELASAFLLSPGPTATTYGKMFLTILSQLP